MGLYGKSKKDLEAENKLLHELLCKHSNISQPMQKQVMYQCRYCGYKSIRKATDGAPLTQANCPKHPRGWCKGVHSWQRTFL